MRREIVIHLPGTHNRRHLFVTCFDEVRSTQLHQRKINSETVIPASLWKAARMHQIPVCLSACLHKFGARVGDLGAVIVAELDVCAYIELSSGGARRRPRLINASRAAYPTGLLSEWSAFWLIKSQQLHFITNWEACISLNIPNPPRNLQQTFFFPFGPLRSISRPRRRSLFQSPPISFENGEWRAEGAGRALPDMTSDISPNLLVQLSPDQEHAKSVTLFQGLFYLLVHFEAALSHSGRNEWTTRRHRMALEEDPVILLHRDDTIMLRKRSA